MCFYQRPGSPIQVICIHFFKIASLMGGRAPDQGPMNIARVIHVERSVTPIIFRDFSKVDGVFYNKKTGDSSDQNRSATNAVDERISPSPVVF